MLAGIRWNAGDVAEFLGCHLTEPKAHVVFSRPSRPLAPRRFAAAGARRGLRLAPATRMLFHRGRVFMNGEPSATDKRTARALTALADRRGTCAWIPGLAFS